MRKITLLLVPWLHASLLFVNGDLGPVSLSADASPNHSSIVFTEDFEEFSIDQVIRRWDAAENVAGMSFSSDVPPLSPGRQSLMMTSVAGRNRGGHLYKQLAEFGGYDTLFARFYVKFAKGCHPVDHFPGMGGYNPPTPYPQGGAGTKPDGDDRFTTRVEPIGSQWRWDFYTYWMHMRGNPHPGTYWGNTFHPTPPIGVERGRWICVELMVICNNPVDSYNGEQAFWIDGRKVIHLGEGFPNGYWEWDKFYPDPHGTPFEGFQWRIVDELKVNYFWLLFYNPGGDYGQVDTVWFDDVVVATEYIGTATEVNEEERVVPHDLYLEALSNPFSEITQIRYILPHRGHMTLSVYTILGEEAKTLFRGTQDSGEHFAIWDGRDAYGDFLPSGIYLLQMETEGLASTKKVVLLR